MSTNYRTAASAKRSTVAAVEAASGLRPYPDRARNNRALAIDRHRKQDVCRCNGRRRAAILR